MIKYLTVVSCFLIWFSFNAKAQFGKFLSLEGIDWRKDSLHELIDVIKDKKCIVLSEPNHGYGRAFDAQSCIIKNLIETSDRKVVLLMEASWINCDMITRLLQREGISSIPKTFRYLTSMDLLYWKKTGFWDFICTKIVEGKLELKGFDIAGTSSEFVAEMFEEAKAKYKVLHYINSIKDAKAIGYTFGSFNGWQLQSVLDLDFYDKIKHFVQIVTSVYEQEQDYLRVEQWKGVLDFFFWIYRRTLVLKDNKIINQIENDKQSSLFWGIRDSLMAELFLKRISNYPDQKIVCKMATRHSGKKISDFQEIMKCCREQGVRSMGELISEVHPELFFSICFVTGTGQQALSLYPWQKDEGIQVRKPPNGSLEDWLMKKGGNYYFVNLEDETWRNSIFTMHAIYERFLSAQWSRHFSAVFYIREMEPLDLLPDLAVPSDQGLLK